MKYYKHNSIPLEEIELWIGESGFDEFGNYVLIDMFEKPMVIISTVLKDGELINDYSNDTFLKAFWAQTNKKIAGYEIQDAGDE